MTMELSSGGKADQLKELMVELVLLQGGRDKLDARITEIRADLEKLFPELGLSKFENELGHWAYTPPGITNSLDKDALKLSLLAVGLTADMIEKAFKDNTKQSPKKACITFRPVREN